jgi:hypothetical protein
VIVNFRVIGVIFLDVRKKWKKNPTFKCAPLSDTLGNYNAKKVRQNDEVNKLDIELALHFKGQSTYK